LKVLITGIAGFLGRNLIQEFTNHDLFGLDINNDFIDGIEVFASSDLDKINEKPDVIIICHAAISSGIIAASSDSLYEVNVALTKKIVKKFTESSIIYVSTASIYDINENPFQENSRIQPQSEYAISKLWAENIVSKNKKSIIIRLSSLYGIGMKENTILPNYINQALSNKKINIWGNGQRKQNYIHVSDVVKFIKTIVENSVSHFGEKFLVVDKKEYTNLELANIIAQVTQSEIIFTQQDNSKSYIYNNKYTQTKTNWQPIANFEEKIIEYIKWKQK